MNAKTVFFEVYCETEDSTFAFVHEATQKLLADAAAIGAAADEIDGTLEQVKVRQIDCATELDAVLLGLDVVATSSPLAALTCVMMTVWLREMT
mgnify:CR=1 FL=1